MTLANAKIFDRCGEKLSSISTEIAIEPKSGTTIERFSADVYFENGRMIFIFKNAMLSIDIDNAKLEELKALIEQERVDMQ